jgi:hypothetical protein
MKDMHSQMSIIAGIGPVALEADNTPAAIDLRGFDAAEIIFSLGIGAITFTGTNRIDVEISHSDDDVSYSRPTADDFLGEVAVSDGTSGYSIVKSFIVAHAAAADYRLGYVGGKRYLKILFNFGGTHTDTKTPLHAIVLGLHPSVAPVAADI